jgi:hypothetical protein
LALVGGDLTAGVPEAAWQNASRFPDRGYDESTAAISRSTKQEQKGGHFMARSWKVACLFAVAVVLLAGSADGPLAQDEKEEGKAPRKVRGRLPDYYIQVVTVEQREEIYAIQEGYWPKIDKLEAELAELRAKMKKEIEGVLSAEQRQEVKELEKAAEQRRQEEKDDPDAARRAALRRPVMVKKPVLPDGPRVENPGGARE